MDVLIFYCFFAISLYALIIWVLLCVILFTIVIILIFKHVLVSMIHPSALTPTIWGSSYFVSHTRTPSVPSQEGEAPRVTFTWYLISSTLLYTSSTRECSIFSKGCDVVVFAIFRTRVFQREEKNLNTALATSCDKWVSSAYEVLPPFPLSFLSYLTSLLYRMLIYCISLSLSLYQVEGPLYSCVLSLFIHSLAQWEENRIILLRQLLVLAHARKISSSPIKTLVIIL